jgi:hypothetical protein
VVAEVLADRSLTATCVQALRGELVSGELVSGERRAAGCVSERQRVTRAVIKAVKGRPVFGVVENHRSTTARALLTLSLAGHCRFWPLRGGQRRVLTVVDMQHLRCELHRYSGELQIIAVTADGRRYADLLSIKVEDGRAVLPYVALDHVLRTRGFNGLDAFEALELGEGGWAGRVNLVTLRAALADVHAVWVGRGRGVPALFVRRHPQHLGTADARVLASEAVLIRQARDYQAVVEGQLSPLTFLERHPSSSYGLELERRLAGGAPAKVEASPQRATSDERLGEGAAKVETSPQRATSDERLD